MHNTMVSGVFPLPNVAAAEPSRADGKQRGTDSGEFRKALESERNNAERRKSPTKGEQRESAAAAQGNARQSDQSTAGGEAPASRDAGSIQAVERDGRSAKVSRGEDAATTQPTAPSMAEQQNDIPAAQMPVPLSDLTPAEIDAAFAGLASGAESDANPALLPGLPLHTQVSLNTIGQAVSGIAMQWRSGSSNDTDSQRVANPVAELIRLIANGDGSLSPQSDSVLTQSPEDVAALLAKALQMPGSQNLNAPGFANVVEGFLQGQPTDGGKDLPHQFVLAGATKQAGLIPLDDILSQARTQLNSQLFERSAQATTMLLDTDIETLQDAMAISINSAARTTGLQEALDAIPLSAPPRVTAEAVLPAVFSLPGQVRAALGQPQWQTAVAERVMTMAAQRLSSAEIQLDPPELGHLQVRVTLNQEQAHVSFVSHHAAVREALDQTAYRLRDMFENEGFNLVDVDVSDQSFSGDQQQSEPAPDTGPGAVNDPLDSSTVATVTLSNQLVDQFV